jgi:hypothetical protein
MKIQKALDRIKWRFGGNDNKYPFPVNETDIEAFNVINNYISQTQSKQFIDNELFAKLYILVYAKMIEHYKTDVFDDAPRKAIYSLLSKSVKNIILDVTERLNDYGLYDRLKNNDIELIHPSLNLNKDITKQKINNAYNKNTDLLDDVWSYEDVKECLIVEVNNCLNIFK